jgi:hypothetical protein
MYEFLTRKGEKPEIPIILFAALPLSASPGTRK